MDGFGDMVHGDYAYTQFRPQDAPNYFTWATHFVLNDNFFASALGPSFPNHLYTIAAQSGGAYANPRQDFQSMLANAAAGRTKSWGCDIAQPAYVDVFGPEGETVELQPCFDFKTEGDLLREARHPVGLLRGDEQPAGLHLVGLLGDRPLSQRPGAVGRVHPTGGRPRPRREAEPAATRDLGDAAVRPVRAPRLQLLLRRELDHPGRERDHGQPRVEEHRDLHHLGRLRRFLRPRAAARGRHDGLRDPGADADDLAVREDRLHRPHRGGVLLGPALHRGQLGAHAADGARIATPTT